MGGLEDRARDRDMPDEPAALGQKADDHPVPVRFRIHLDIRIAPRCEKPFHTGAHVGGGERFSGFEGQDTVDVAGFERLFGRFELDGDDSFSFEGRDRLGGRHRDDHEGNPNHPSKQAAHQTDDGVTRSKQASYHRSLPAPSPKGVRQ